MSNFVYLISTTYLKDNSPINENVDDKLLKSAIKEAQENSRQETKGFKFDTIRVLVLKVEQYS